MIVWKVIKGPDLIITNGFGEPYFISKTLSVAIHFCVGGSVTRLVFFRIRALKGPDLSLLNKRPHFMTEGLFSGHFNSLMRLFERLRCIVMKGQRLLVSKLLKGLTTPLRMPFLKGLTSLAKML